MKYGTAYKNLTDAILLVAAVLAIISILLAVVSFEKPEMTVEDKATGEQITIKSPFENPEVKVYIKLAIVFLATALMGFLVRKWFLLPIAASVVSIIISMDVFLDGSIEKLAYGFVLFGVVGLAGNIIHAVVVVRENKEAIKEKLASKNKKAKAK